MVDSGVVSSWSGAVAIPSAFTPDDYPYRGWAQEWLMEPGYSDGYGGASTTWSLELSCYTAVTSCLAWTDQTPGSVVGNLMVMPLGAVTPVVAIAGDASLNSMTGGLMALTAGGNFSVSTSVSCPTWSSTAPMARFRLVTNAITGPTGATTTYSPPISGDGPLSWAFQVPAGTVAAYLAVDSLTGSSQDVLTFTLPSLHFSPGALGYLSGANAVPMRVAQIQMPAYYRKNGWPTAARYLIKNPGSLSFGASGPATGTPTQIPATQIDTSADARYLPATGYSQASGTWTPWYSNGTHGLTWLAASADQAPYYASVDDAQAYSYQSGGRTLFLPSLAFDANIGTWLYSDDLNTAGVTEYTVIMVLAEVNNYSGFGGLWSSAPTATGGGPDTAADLSTFNYRALDSTGTALRMSSAGMSDQNLAFDAISIHKPTYLAMTFSDSGNAVYCAQNLPQVTSIEMPVSGVSGALNGTVVLGADATQGLSSGTFSLFDLNIYFRALTAGPILREFGLLSQAYG